MKDKKADSARPARAHRPKAIQSHEIRIIGGDWKRTKFKVADKPGLRPTPDRVRETLFNWLGQDLTGWRCMDVFAGTGVLGFEAASRGAQDVVVVEQDSVLVAQMQRVQTQLKAQMVRVQRGDGVATLRQVAAASLQLIFLDPPFDAPVYTSALQAAARALAPAGYVYLESGTRWNDELLAPFGLHVHRYLKAGAVHAHLLRAAEV